MAALAALASLTRSSIIRIVRGAESPARAAATASPTSNQASFAVLESIATLATGIAIRAKLLGWIDCRSSILTEHDLFGKPGSTFPDHALMILLLHGATDSGAGVPSAIASTRQQQLHSLDSEVLTWSALCVQHPSGAVQSRCRAAVTDIQAETGGYSLSRE